MTQDSSTEITTTKEPETHTVPNPDITLLTRTRSNVIQPNWENFEPSFVDKAIAETFIIDVTGIHPSETQALVDKVTLDHHNIRQRYNIPPRKNRPSPKNYNTPKEFETHVDIYAQQLKEIADQIGYSVVTPEEIPEYFEQHPHMKNLPTFYDPENKIICTPRPAPGSSTSLSSYLAALEHELIHAKQKESDPNMSPEQMEYEAHVAANIYPPNIAKKPDLLLSILTFQVLGSVTHAYNEIERAKST